MKGLFASVLLVLTGAAHAAADASSASLDDLCMASSQEGALAELVENQLVPEEGIPLSGAEVLMQDCGGQSLLEALVETQQAENLEYAVIDMGVDVNAPLVREERGLLTLTQFLMQKAAVGRTAEVRAFALEYMQNFRDADFNPNLHRLSMN